MHNVSPEDGRTVHAGGILIWQIKVISCSPSTIVAAVTVD